MIFSFICLSKAFSQVNLSDKIKQNVRINGTKLIHQEGDSIKIYTTFKNKKVSEIFATNKNGEKYNVIYNTTSDEGASQKGGLKLEPIKCVVCITSTDGKIIQCWDIKCSDMPTPKKTT